MLDKSIGLGFGWFGNVELLMSFVETNCGSLTFSFSNLAAAARFSQIWVELPSDQIDGNCNFRWKGVQNASSASAIRVLSGLMKMSWL